MAPISGPEDERAPGRPAPRPDADGWRPMAGLWARRCGHLVLLIGPVAGRPGKWEALLQTGQMLEVDQWALGPVGTPMAGEWWRVGACAAHGPGAAWGDLPILVTVSMDWWTSPERREMVECGCLKPDASDHPQ